MWRRCSPERPGGGICREFFLRRRSALAGPTAACPARRVSKSETGKCEAPEADVCKFSGAALSVSSPTPPLSLASPSPLCLPGSPHFLSGAAPPSQRPLSRSPLTLTHYSRRSRDDATQLSHSKSQLYGAYQMRLVNAFKCQVFTFRFVTIISLDEPVFGCSTAVILFVS